MIREVLRMGDPRLWQKSLPVDHFNSSVLDALIADMRETMAHLNGAGLAAPQIGVGLRVVIFGVKANPRYVDIPVLMLTGQESVQKKVAGLELGASDYVTKPFAKDELIARVRVHLKLKLRAGGTAAGPLPAPSPATVTSQAAAAPAPTADGHQTPLLVLYGANLGTAERFDLMVLGLLDAIQLELPVVAVGSAKEGEAILDGTSFEGGLGEMVRDEAPGDLRLAGVIGLEPGGELLVDSMH